MPDSSRIAAWLGVWVDGRSLLGHLNFRQIAERKTCLRPGACQAVPTGDALRANAVDGARLGLAVSKRVARKATRRNQLKRLIRETFRGVSRGLPSLDIFVLLKPLAATVDCEDLRSSVARALSRLNANQARPSKTRKR